MADNLRSTRIGRSCTMARNPTDNILYNGLSDRTTRLSSALAPLRNAAYPVNVGSRGGRPEVAVSGQTDAFGRVGMWRGGCRSNISVAASFVWRCLNGSAMAPFPHPAHRTGHADLPHPALGQNFTPSPTTRRAQAGIGVRARSARRDARVDRSRPCVA
jgi:hypothetical protein